jgi:hypothetical protein
MVSSHLTKTAKLIVNIAPYIFIFMPNTQLNAEKKEKETWRVPEIVLDEVELVDDSE